MKIGIDARVLDRQITGTGRYLLNILLELPKQDNVNEYYIFTGSELPVDKSFYKIINYKKSIIPFKIYSPYYINVILPKLLKANNIDILFSANVLIPIVKMPGIKCISVIHDAIPWIYPEYYPFFYKRYLNFFVPRSLKMSDVVVTVSEHSKRDLSELFNLSDHKIKVVYNTALSKFRPAADIADRTISEKLELPDKYLLYVGAIEKRKNVLGLIKIFDMLREKGSDLKLVIIGKPGYDNKRIMPEIEKRSESIKYLQFLGDDLLTYVYQRAFSFIFPSYYEGFGIPPLEAMQCGIPVLSSDTSALNEVVGDGGLLHPPHNYIGFVNDICKLEKDIEFYNFMKSKALEQSKKFNIQDNTKKVIDIFNGLESK